MLLMIYSLGECPVTVVFFACSDMLSLKTHYFVYTVNMNVVTWGTREVQTKKTKAEVEKEKREAEKRKVGGLGALGSALKNGGDGDDVNGHLTFACGNLFKVACCLEEQRPADEAFKIVRLAERMADRRRGGGGDRLFQAGSRRHQGDGASLITIDERHHAMPSMRSRARGLDGSDDEADESK